MNQPKCLKFKNYLHITAPSYDNILILICHFLIKILRTCVMFELNHLIKDPACFQSSNTSCIDNFRTSNNVFSIRVFFHRTAVEGRGPSFIPLYHFHLLTNNETFVCNFACEMTITYL